MNQPSPSAQTTQISPSRDDRQFALTKSVVVTTSDFEPEKPKLKLKSLNKSIKAAFDNRVSFADFETKRMKNFKVVLKEAQKKRKKKYGQASVYRSIDATVKHKHSRSFLPQIPNIAIAQGTPRDFSDSQKNRNLSVVDEGNS